MRLRGLAAEPAFEKAITPAVDYLERRREVLSDCIGLIGYSLGGYYVARAAAFERRLKALVIWGAMWDNLHVAHHHMFRWITDVLER